MAEKIRLSGLVLAENNAATITRCLKSMSFCDELIVVDGGSTDGTVELARSLATRVETRRFDHFGAQRAYSRELARGEWLFFLDTDEAATPELAAEIRALLEAEARGAAASDGYLVRRRFHYPSTWGVAGSLPQTSIRLFRKSAGRWNAAKLVHEGLDFTGTRGRLAALIEHWPWTDLADVLAKSLRYGTAAARQMHAAGKRGGGCAALGHALARFLKHYLRDGGWRRGSAGFILAAAIALEPFLKYAGAWELARQEELAAPPGAGRR